MGDRIRDWIRRFFLGGARGAMESTVGTVAMMTMELPEDPRLLEAVGRVALFHGHLDFALRYLIKSLSGCSVQEALDATAYDGSRELRLRASKLARQRLGEGAALIRIQALLQRCASATQKRNDLIHRPWARQNGKWGVRTSDHEWDLLPTVEELNELADDLRGRSLEINQARLGGFLSDALAKKGQ